jgi:HTH-type transcriptional regulator / antitoxin HigA
MIKISGGGQMQALQLKSINKIWSVSKPFFTVPKTKKEYEKLVSILDDLIYERADESLIETIGVLVEQYEDKNVHVDDASPAEVLKYLMEENNLKQVDLKNEIGSQGLISDILNGKRELSKHNIKALSKRFHVSADVFL